jgi:putative tricarboxylic transport membrane protein
MFAVLLLALGADVMLMGILSDGLHIAAYAWRGPLSVSGGKSVSCVRTSPNGARGVGRFQVPDCSL